MRCKSVLFTTMAVVIGWHASATLAAAAPATFVSGTGTNAGACPATAPCATLQFAHDQTDAGGVIAVVSSGSFGPVTISKSISIVADGAEALIQTGTAACGSNSVGAAVCITAAASDVVHLQGLTVDLKGVRKHGIGFNTGAALHVRNSVIRNTTSTSGILFFPAAASSLFVSDTSIADTAFGISVAPAGAGSAKVVLIRVQSDRPSFHGFLFTYTASGSGTIAATVRDSTVSKASHNAIAASRTGTGTQTIDVMVDRSALVNSDVGVQAAGTGVTVRVGDSTITGNATAIDAGAGTEVELFPTNKRDGNGDDSASQLSVGRRR
jgi:hypothetical protein